MTKPQEIPVLIIDDDKTMLKLLQTVLEVGGFFNIYTESSTKGGIDTFRKYNIPLVITDINIEGHSSGIDILKIVKKECHNCQVIIITGYTDDKILLEALRAGASDFIYKPCIHDFILHAVTKCAKTYMLLKDNEDHQIHLEHLVRKKTKQLKIVLQKTVESLSKVLEVRDAYTANHQTRVTILSRLIAEELECSEDELVCLDLAATLHDIGKLYVPQELLVKPTKLSKIEFELIKNHSEAGYQILKNIPFDCNVAGIVRQHHEKLDGSGYPLGLKGDEIYKCTRILTVADVVEAMSSHRPYRSALTVEIALEEITKKSGVEYCNKAVEGCLSVLKKYDNNIETLFSRNSN